MGFRDFKIVKKSSTDGATLWDAQRDEMLAKCGLSHVCNYIIKVLTHQNLLLE